ncbi:hypothetical protein PIB30_003807 [Stylosanthes scabra]|uniref:Myb-like protein X n=1 Tax=Stylosanthes scabra TaxID=79078 RepID=A0ABU6S3V3_9FABA|nr:hypothetical protein [Stylosanthes scabra]
MSRCFPFPPPGYEKEARADEVDLLKKEKHKEKKHRKEKKDKGKKDSKEKREKEGRDGKHKEKKDKKDKHREKKKDKEKDKDKDKDKEKVKEKEKDRDKVKVSDRDKTKTGTADDKEFPRHAEGPNVGKAYQKETKQSDKKGTFVEEKPAKQHTIDNGEKVRQNNHLAKENKDSKFVMEFDRMVRDDNGGAGNHLVQFTNTDHRKEDEAFRFVGKGSGTWFDGKERLNDKAFNAKKIDGKGIQAQERPFANAAVPNHVGNFHPRVDGTPKVLEKNRTLEAGNIHPRVDGVSKIMEKKIEKTLEANIEGKERVKEKKDEGKEKVKEKKDEGKEKVKEKKDEKRREKRKDREKEKKGHGKDKDRDKEKKKEEKPMENTEVKNVELNKSKEGNKAGPVGLTPLSQVKNSHENAVTGENPKKRKDVESNGVPRANDNWPSKLPRPSSSHLFTENGRILEPCQVSVPNASDRQGGAATNVKIENKEGKINGIIDTQPIEVPSNKSRTAPPVPAEPVIEATVKPPHPDAKYLSQVYSIPKMEEWSGFDDQEWLFGSSNSQETRPVVGSSEVAEPHQVWAEGFHIEPVDVFALPYVIPY